MTQAEKGETAAAAAAAENGKDKERDKEKEQRGAKRPIVPAAVPDSLQEVSPAAGAQESGSIAPSPGPFQRRGFAAGLASTETACRKPPAKWKAFLAGAR